jgi:hypothetical protein
MDKRGRFVAAFVASEPQKWQSYLRLAERPGFFADFAAGFFFLPLRVWLAAGLLEVAFLVCDTGFVDAPRPSAGALYTGRNRMSSPIQWYV